MEGLKMGDNDSVCGFHVLLRQDDSILLTELWIFESFARLSVN